MSLIDSASLILTPNAYKEGKLYSVIPSDGSGDFTFTRATTATRVNSDGLVELVPYNLLSYSEQFDNAYWTKRGSTITANVTTAPDGQTTADELKDDTSSFLHDLFFEPTGYAENSYFTLSAFVKANTISACRLIASQTGNVNYAFASFNLSTKATTATLSGTFTNPTSKIDTFPNGWLRVSLTFQTGSGGALTWSSSGCSIRLEKPYQTQIYTGTGQSLYVWGAQLELGSTATTYQKTETRLNIPRLDYSLGGCPNILLEPQRTNLALQSSSFDNATWTKVASSVTANQIASPSGVQDADKLTENSANEIHGLNNLSPYPSITTATASLFFKKGTRKFFSIKLQIGANSYTQVYDSESVTTTSNSSNGLTSVSSTIVDFGNGWVRATLTGTNPSGAGNTYIIYCLSDSGTPTFDPVNFNPTYQGTGTDYGYLWGAQIEAGSYATSYIPTTTASVTRNLDDSSVTSFSSGIGQTEGVLFTEVAFGSTDNGVKWIAFLWLSGSSYIGIYTDSNGRILAEVVNSGIQFAATSSVFALPNEKHKIALAYKANDFAFYIDGVQIALDNSGTVPACDQVRFNYNTTADKLTQRYYGSLILWKERLTNDQLAQLTTI